MSDYAKGLYNSSDTGIEYDTYIKTINEVENNVIDDDIQRKVKSNKCKTVCFFIAEVAKAWIRHLKTMHCKEKSH